MSSDVSQGYPIRRNNSCSAGEFVCGQTWGTFYACCPSSSRCFNSTKINNFICCPNYLDCTDSLYDPPTCADTSWDLYNSTGYFCCEPNQAGFSIEGTSSVGCLNPGAARNLSYNVLTPSSMGTSSTTPTSTPASIPTSSLGAGSSTSASSTSAHSSRTNTGAIGGGVAGGVVGAAALVAALYLLIRYRKRQQPRQQPQSHAPPSSLPRFALEKAASQPKELGNGHMPAELSDHSVNKRHELGNGHMPAELSDHSLNKRHELPTAS